MKIFFNIKSMAFVVLLALLGSCKSDFLDLKPVSSLVSGTLTTAQDAENELTGAYSRLATNGYFQYNRYYITEGINDNHYVNGDNPQEWLIENFKFDASNGVIQGCYTDLFSHISAANAVLSDVPSIVDSKWSGTTRKEQILAEASFLRALNYYELVTQFGGVPIITSISQGGNYYPTRNTEQEVYAQIIKDLVYAESNLPLKPYNNQYGRATKGVAQAYLAKTYAQMGDYANSLVYANKVISSNTYSLVSDFGKLWSNKNKNTTESIFEIQVPGGGTPYNFFGFDIFVDSDFKFPKRNIASKALVDAFAAAGDNGARYKATINFAVTTASFNMPANAWDASKAIPFMFKYPDPNGFASDDNIVIVRLADIMLLAAEANVQLGNLDAAINLLNQIKKRAGLPNTTAKTKNEVALAVLNERRLELVFECTRWNDLKRADKNGIVNVVEIMNNQKDSFGKSLGYTMAADKHQFIFPIPEQDRQLNKNLTQNTGY
ncbi:RagB/SusD family nutrient uptake outer membrane protein [Arcicella sp. LKC2W]|uniref:RagB/SusD family nutrient uptake outer membrane protein n=1 Tax=Arcicella sp. LKC2W TaxID=2984198 RepID=UPI002B20CF82|nr:RagB/SusD family nutrient uptake outer membrane protein [Arcicella sp. LKC2W]MEA5461473.1 RagB/SusD family nutrient uptake outer membrane protein [Arcicella sp. LKC2W]